MLNYPIAIISGDGVGPELTDQAIKLFHTLEEFTNLRSAAPNTGDLFSKSNFRREPPC